MNQLPMDDHPTFQRPKPLPGCTTVSTTGCGGSTAPGVSAKRYLGSLLQMAAAIHPCRGSHSSQARRWLLPPCSCPTTHFRRKCSAGSSFSHREGSCELLSAYQGTQAEKTCPLIPGKSFSLPFLFFMRRGTAHTLTSF